MDNQMITVRGVVSFPSLTSPDQMSGKYSVQIGNLSDKAVERLEEAGATPKFKEDAYNRGRFIECKSKFPIDNSKFSTVVDTTGANIDPSSVGPGSVVVATIKTYDWSMGGRKGVGTRLLKMVVEELGEPMQTSNNLVVDNSDVL
jgi:hypothetical protein